MTAEVTGPGPVAGRNGAAEHGPVVDLRTLTVGLLGGTGEQGRGLARRWAAAGLRLRIGSRDAGRARLVAAELSAGVPGSDCTGGDTGSVCDESDIAVVVVPYAGHADLLRPLRGRLAGKIVVDCANPIGFDDHGPYRLPVADGSAAEQAAALLPDSRVVAAFHHLSAVLLADPDIPQLDCDVLVLGDDRAAVGVVQELAGAIPGVRGVHAGRLRNAGQVEALTANLIAVNRRYRAHAGIRLTDV
ncbi:MAG TPA: NADPH-dependent F420 reductase [Mycobacteriales bacterium]|nr:NADPH-dependent F420 reductase [Mycobacteriales bacterium]